jgi:hypothetical protein
MTKVTFQEYVDHRNVPPAEKYLPLVSNICQSILSDCTFDSSKQLCFRLGKEKELLSIYPKTPCSYPLNKDGATLHSLICEGRISSPIHRLALAVAIASSILQLHSTPWLPQSWSAKSILHPLDISSVDLDRFYVTAPLQITTEELEDLEPRILNPYLVGLGVFLLELAEEKSFEEWIHGYQMVAPETEYPISIQEQAGLAWIWLKQSGMRLGGPVYVDVVEKCLMSTYTFEQTGGNLKLSVETRIAIYRDVVEQLETIYEMFTGVL